MDERKRERLGLFICLALFGGFFAAVAFPNLWQALNRSHQKVTMSDMRSIATALEARATDRNSYAIGAMPDTPATALQFAFLNPVTLDELERALSPVYIKKMPRLDGWGNSFEVRVTPRSYAIRSRGSDGRFETDSYEIGTIDSFKQDLVFGDGNFIRYPEGT